jgi:hypothetical protein
MVVGALRPLLLSVPFAAYNSRNNRDGCTDLHTAGGWAVLLLLCSDSCFTVAAAAVDIPVHQNTCLPPAQSGSKTHQTDHACCQASMFL